MRSEQFVSRFVRIGSARSVSPNDQPPAGEVEEVWRTPAQISGLVAYFFFKLGGRRPAQNLIVQFGEEPIDLVAQAELLQTRSD